MNSYAAIIIILSSSFSFLDLLNLYSYSARNRAENALDEMKDVYSERSNNVSEERRNAARLLTEVENLSLRLFYMETAKNDVRGDIAVMRRAAEKTENVVAQSEIDKQKQVCFYY